jgi:hypothetical protein
LLQSSFYFSLQGLKVQASAQPLAAGVDPIRRATILIEKEIPSNSPFKKGEDDNFLWNLKTV